MNTKRETVGLGWFQILAGTSAVAVANGMGAQPTESAAEEAYAHSCLAPYHDELAGWQAAQLDEESYRRVVLAARAAAADTCSAFVERIEREGQPGVQESPYLIDARDLLQETPRGRCIEARAISEVARSAESLFRLAVCHLPGKEGTALLREAVKVDPQHLGSLQLLTSFDLDPRARAGYGESLYQRGGDIENKMDAAKAIIEWAVDRGDSAAAQEIHERVRRELLNQPPLRRCTVHLDVLGLEELCLEAIESVAANALAAGEPLSNEFVSLVTRQLSEARLMIDLPRDVRSEAEVAEILATPGVRTKLVADYSNVPKYLEIIEDEVEFAKLLRGEPDFVELLDHDTLLADWLGRESWEVRKSAQAERLNAVLDNHPEPLRSAVHRLALALFAPTWRERIALLRGAVESDPGHVRARCQLADALAVTGDLAGARRGYEELLAVEDGSCNARAALDALDDRAPAEAVPLDEPHGIVVLH